MKYEEIMTEVTKVKEQRGQEYRNEPRHSVPLEVLLGMVRYKAVRAHESIKTTKTRDELVDIINYTLFAIEKIDETRS